MNRRIMIAAVALVVAVVAGGLVFAFTGSDDEQPTASVDVVDYCDAAAERIALTEVLDPFTVDPSRPETIESTLDEARDSLQRASDAAPEEIVVAYSVINDAFAEVFVLFEETDFDLEQLAANFSAEELAGRLDGESIDEAEQAIDAYEAVHCGQQLPPTPVDVTEVAGLINDTFSEDELRVAFDFVGVDTVEDLAAAILDGKVSLEDLDQVTFGRSDAPFTLGDSAELDVLWRSCEEGDFEACDGLYGAAPANSEYQRFAASCGDRANEPVAGSCADDA